MNQKLRGFTLPELIMVILILSILSVIAIPYLNDKTFAERGFYDAVKATLRHAQHIAVASRRFVCVNLNATSGVIAVTKDITEPENVTTINCNNPVQLASPDTEHCSQTNQLCASQGVTLNTSVDLTFDPLGRLVSSPNVLASPVTISITNVPTITIVPETGFVQ